MSIARCFIAFIALLPITLAVAEREQAPLPGVPHDLVQNAENHETAISHGATLATTDMLHTHPAPLGHRNDFNDLTVGLTQLDPLKETLSALSTMQTRFFETWLGDWPTAIDWTAAVINTHLIATLGSLSRSKIYLTKPEGSDAACAVHSSHENLINRYFAQTSAFYFGEEAYSIRLQAYDDMLWVVLEWLEAIKFIKSHNKLHYPHSNTSSPEASAATTSWHGKQFEQAFAHRAHVFYDLVDRGWEDKLCGGGLTWNPRLETYKNAITNQLYISAAVGMFLWHPGDANRSPFIAAYVDEEGNGRRDVAVKGNGEEIVLTRPGQGPQLPSVKAHDKRYLRSAIRAYEWLKDVNMTNEQGLYVDGYHISHRRRNNTVCDARNEMVYTYNQGVLLSGLRGLWEGTGTASYLSDGYELVRSVVGATGWDEEEECENKSPQWAGLGRAGILHDVCDSTGTCNQDAQTFKGVFFHHLTAFCEPLPTADTGPMIANLTFVASDEQAKLHARMCRGYILWVKRNARAALGTRDERGVMGMWWGAGRRRRRGEGGHDGNRSVEVEAVTPPPLQRGAVDVWRDGVSVREVSAVRAARAEMNRKNQGGEEHWAKMRLRKRDYNDRGRGRTVETQSGGLAVLRALHELTTRYGGVDEL